MQPHERRREDGTILTSEEFVVPPCGMGYVCGEVPICRGVDLGGYFYCSKGVFYSTPSHRWGTLYFPRFLLREGSFPEMYMASLIVLVTPMHLYQLW